MKKPDFVVTQTNFEPIKKKRWKILSFPILGDVINPYSVYSDDVIPLNIN